MTLAVGAEGSHAAMPRRLAPPYPVIYTLPYPARQSRWKAALRLLLALPELIALMFVYWLLYPLALASWLIIVFSGRLDRTIWGFSVAILCWVAAALSYVTLLRDEYPAAGRGYPMRFEVAYPVVRSRVRTLFRLVLILPQAFVVDVLLIPLAVGAVVAWCAILLSGQYPEGIWRFAAGLNRWILRVAAYGLLLRDDYPPYTLGLWEPATLEALGVAFESGGSVGAPSLAETRTPGLLAQPKRPAGIPIWPESSIPSVAPVAPVAGVANEAAGASPLAVVGQLPPPERSDPPPDDDTDRDEPGFFSRPAPPAPAQPPDEPPPSAGCSFW